jgi:hypothetical protein
MVIAAAWSGRTISLAAGSDAAHVDLIERTLARSLAAAIAPLGEPKARAPERALRLVEPLVETIAGIAIGTIVNGLAGAARRAYGEGAARDVLVALKPLVAAAGAAPAHGRYLRDAAARPLIDDFAARLHATFTRIPLAAIVAAARAAAVRHAIDRAPAFSIALDAVGRDDRLAHRLGDEIARGWAAYRAVIAGEPASTMSPLWIAWCRALRGEAEPGAAPDHEYILRVA